MSKPHLYTKVLHPAPEPQLSQLADVVRGGFGMIDEKRMEELWHVGGTLVMTYDLGDNDDTGRIWWKCKGYGRQY